MQSNLLLLCSSSSCSSLSPSLLSSRSSGIRFSSSSSLSWMDAAAAAAARFGSGARRRPALTNHRHVRQYHCRYYHLSREELQQGKRRKVLLLTGNRTRRRFGSGSGILLTTTTTARSIGTTTTTTTAGTHHHPTGKGGSNSSGRRRRPSNAAVTWSSLSSSSSSLLDYDEDYDEDDQEQLQRYANFDMSGYDYRDEAERFTERYLEQQQQQQRNSSSMNNNNTTAATAAGKQKIRIAEEGPSSLDLELGESNIWDRRRKNKNNMKMKNGRSRSVADEGDDDYDNDEDDDDDRPWYEEEEEDDDQGGSDEDEVDVDDNSSSHLSAESILSDFDPQHPPFPLSATGLTAAQLEELQLWLECESQQESVRRYQAVVSAAVDRRDYGSLTAMQRLVVHWFPALVAAITEQQEEYLKWEKNKNNNSNQDSSSDNDKDSSDKKSTTARMKKKKKKKKKQQQQNDDNSSSSSQSSFMKYGPYLCSLPADKLAVVVSHEALMYCLLKSNHASNSGSNKNHHYHQLLPGGIPLVHVAADIGNAVENEVLIHRVLLQRRNEKQQQEQEQQQQQQQQLEDKNGTTNTNDGGSGLLTGLTAAVSDNDGNDDSDNDTFNNSSSSSNSNSWSYGASHLQQYLDELNRGGNHGTTAVNRKHRRLIVAAVNRARQVLLHEQEPWSDAVKVQLGAALMSMLLRHATLPSEDHDRSSSSSSSSSRRRHNSKNNSKQQRQRQMAFSYEKRWIQKNKLQGFIVLHDELYRQAFDSGNTSSFLEAPTTTRHRPMIVPPSPWTEPNKGGYRWLKVDLMRYHGCQSQKEALQHADLSTVYDGLDALGRVPWRINRKILSVAQHCWENNIALGEIPTRTDYELPDVPAKPERPQNWKKFASRNSDDDSDNDNDNGIDEKSRKLYKQQQHAYREAVNKYNRIKQKNMDLNSLRCSTALKLDQAAKFQHFDAIYFPYNVDFRGRAYPVPPHLSNIGSDLCRGLLKFAAAKPLGDAGLYWLQVHLANLAGADKISFDDRVAFVQDNMRHVRAAAEDPFGDDDWWMTALEDPFQGLATCAEIVAAIDSGRPERYECSLPVHMDGSCNGLQHYAALGRDTAGGRAVNLCPPTAAEDSDNDIDMYRPADVYTGVMEEVIRRVAAEADRVVDAGLLAADLKTLSADERKLVANSRSAKLVNGLIDRGVVKRTVMTKCYGVTYIGARQQIQEKIEEKLEQLGYDVDENQHEVFQACGYLAAVTMDVMGDLFTGAEQTMDWLTTCARMISQHGTPVAWMSPTGIPAIQPYRQKKTATVVTALQTVTLLLQQEQADFALPIHKQRQASAFPPNYVHSLDSCHMLLTALEMERRGLAFSAVHDSFWTHACDVDEMNEALREVFVQLYRQPLLERLKESWEMRYPNLVFPDVPETGDLDLEQVKSARYFFQ